MWNIARDADERSPARINESNKFRDARRGRPIDPAEEERTDRQRMALERRQGFERMHTEAGARLSKDAFSGRRGSGGGEKTALAGLLRTLRGHVSAASGAIGLTNC